MGAGLCIMLEVNFVELHFGEVRIMGILRSSLPEIATWQMPRPLCPCILALVTTIGGAEEFSPTLWKEWASGVEEKVIGPVDGIGGM
jgi:hypothetical protein